MTKPIELERFLAEFFGEGRLGNLTMFICLLLILLVTRYGVGLSDWSGKYNSNPTGGAPWGDLECHRTWFAITASLPAR
jgi:hypothetical protein